MPAKAWLDALTNRTVGFDKGWEWPDSPVDPAMLDAMAGAYQDDWHEKNPTVLTPSRLLQPARKTIIEAYVEYPVAPDEVAQMFMGSVFHARLAEAREARGYLVQQKARLYGKLWGCPGFSVSAEPDARMPEFVPGKVMLFEDKFTTAESIGFMFREGNGTPSPKDDHIAQVNVSRLLLGQEWGVDPETIPARISYFCLPTKQNIKALGGWTRMPPCLSMTVPFWDEERVGNHCGGWSPPERPDHPAIPTTCVRDNARLLTAAHEAIAAGRSVESVIATLPCECSRRFRGTGETYCEQQRVCKTLQSGAPV